MKVLLIQSYLGRNELAIFPLGLACLKSSLAGHDVRVYDTNASTRPSHELKEIIQNFAPDVVGISIRNIDSTNKRKVIFYYDYLREAIDVVMECSNSKIIVGGSGFSMFAKEIMEDEPRIDLGVFLEGEATFPKLLQRLEHPENVKSIFYRRDGNVFFSGPGEKIDLNSVDFPDRQSIPLRDYQRIPEGIGIETKRGCSLNCIYCVYGFLNGRKFRLREPGKVVDEIEQMVKEYGLERFMFVDSVFNIPMSHAERICKEMVRRALKVNWAAWFNPNGLTKEFVELVRDAGCRNIILSPDGFSDKILKKLGKNITRNDIIKTHRMLKEIKGFEVSYNFFKTPPGQNLIDFLSLLFFCIKAKIQMRKRVHFEFNSLRVEPHTKLYQIALKEGALRKEENLIYPKYYTNPTTRYIEKTFDAMLILRGR